MIDVKDTFVFHRRYLTAIRRIPESERLAAYELFLDCAFGEKDCSALPYPYNAVFSSMIDEISASRAKYQNAAKNGAKGGRPKQPYIPDTTWIPVLLECGSVAETAKQLDRDEERVQSWVNQSDDSRVSPFKTAKQKTKEKKPSPPPPPKWED